MCNRGIHVIFFWSFLLANLFQGLKSEWNSSHCKMNMADHSIQYVPGILAQESHSIFSKSSLKCLLGPGNFLGSGNTTEDKKVVAWLPVKCMYLPGRQAEDKYAISWFSGVRSAVTGSDRQGAGTESFSKDYHLSWDLHDKRLSWENLEVLSWGKGKAKALR